MRYAKTGGCFGWLRHAVLASLLVAAGVGTGLAADDAASVATAAPDAAGAPTASVATAAPDDGAGAVAPTAPSPAASPASTGAAPTAGAAAPADGGPATARPALSAADEKIATELKTFCLKWMGFLETRERDNRRAVKWQAGPEGVAGQFVGYSKEYDCIMKERSSNGTPVAVIVYREFVYEQKGASQSDAAVSEPAVIDATEVTEIFRYTKGQWVY